MDANNTVIISSITTVVVAVIGIWVGLSKNRGDFKLQQQQLMLSTQATLDAQNKVIFDSMKDMNDRLLKEIDVLKEQDQAKGKRIFELEMDLRKKDDRIFELERKIELLNIN